MTRYEQLAAQIRQQIEDNIWQSEPFTFIAGYGETIRFKFNDCFTIVSVIRKPRMDNCATTISIMLYIEYPFCQVTANKGYMSENVEISTYFQCPSSVKILKLFLWFRFPIPVYLFSLNSVVRWLLPQTFSTPSSVINLPREMKSYAVTLHNAMHYKEFMSPRWNCDYCWCNGIISFSLQAVTEPGDWVVIESPAFYGALHVYWTFAIKSDCH